MLNLWAETAGAAIILNLRQPRFSDVEWAGLLSQSEQRARIPLVADSIHSEMDLPIGSF